MNDLMKELANIKITDEVAQYSASVLSESDLTDAIRKLHFPDDLNGVGKSARQLSLRELVNIQLKLEESRIATAKLKAPEIVIENQKLSNSFIKTLPFTLTEDQNIIITNLIEKIQNRELINMLIQGDVGSGKTIITVILALLLAKAGYQTVILAPTTVLAKQHFITFSNFLEKYDVSIELVTGDKKDTTSKSILIGTSAILARQNKLISNLGLVIIDEQHRFGVKQRKELLKPFIEILKPLEYPHFINMSATPIPRTIIKAFFGDIEVGQIKSKPKGRLPINTRIVPNAKKENLYDWIEALINQKNEQVYWVCPLVTESDKLQISSAKEMYKEITKQMPNMRIALLHGQMKAKDKTEIMKQFTEHKYDILVSTSVIEVGIDVTNATVMVIENAERFGMAQLHQIRGRVGRSDKQSWCFLFHSDTISKDSNKRIEFFSKTKDGLQIAEFDLQNRGPGEIYGTKQAGIPDLKVADFSDISLIEKSKKIAKKLYKEGVRQIELFS